MAFLDKENLYSDAQALTATAASTNIIDHGIDRNLGIGEPMVVAISLDVAADDADADETYVVALQADDNSGFSSATEVGSATITRGDAAGKKYYISIPPSGLTERFTRLNFTLGGTSPSVTVTARLVPQSFVETDVDFKHYASGYTVS